MSVTATWLLSLAPIASLALAGWLIGVMRADVGIADSLWSLFFLLAIGTTWAATWHPSPAPDARALLVTVLVAVWALRLFAHITARNIGTEEDRRYRAMREKHEPGFAWKSLYMVFGLQALLAWIIALPLIVAVWQANGSAPGLTTVDALATTLWCLGFFFEAVGDWQLSRFRSDPASRGRVLQSGLWRYTRHPNYFGELCMWWAFWMFAVPAGGWWTIVSPLLMTALLLRVSGVALLERNIGERRPAYDDYARRTNALLPGPPKRSSVR